MYTRPCLFKWFFDCRNGFSVVRKTQNVHPAVFVQMVFWLFKCFLGCSKEPKMYTRPCLFKWFFNCSNVFFGSPEKMKMCTRPGGPKRCLLLGGWCVCVWCVGPLPPHIPSLGTAATPATDGEGFVLGWAKRGLMGTVKTFKM